MAMPVHKGELPYLSLAQWCEVERILTSVYKMDPLQLEECGGASLARLTRRRFLEDDPRGKPVVVLVGNGGAAAMVCARRLYSWGANVRVFFAMPAASMDPLPRKQLEIIEKMHIFLDDHDALGPVQPPAVIIDGIQGSLLKVTPQIGTPVMTHWANVQKAPILSYMIPTGVDPATGEIANGVMDAKATLSMGLPREALRTRGVKSHVGEMYVADFGIPPMLFHEPTLKLTVPPLFATEEFLRLR